MCGTGARDSLKHCEPEHGWHPVRMRDFHEHEAGASAEAWLRAQRELFATPRLRRLAALCGRELGWEPTSELIYRLYEGVVRAKWVWPVARGPWGVGRGAWDVR